jgi:hypothetical protein
MIEFRTIHTKKDYLKFFLYSSTTPEKVKKHIRNSAIIPGIIFSYCNNFF